MHGLFPAEAYHQVAEKLRMTAAALGCSTRKELCARFRAVNPATHCDIDRLHKWMQGRALPRARGFYDDWAKLLGLSQSGSWLAGCDVAEFRQALPATSSAASLPAVAPAHPRSPGGTGLMGGARILCGDYACYSHAWSPRYRGSLIRGSLAVRPGKARRLVGIYGELLVTGPMRAQGEVSVNGRLIHLLVWEPEGQVSISFTLVMPGPPASVICGVMSGGAFVAHSALPSTTRVLLVRVPQPDALAASNRYIDPSPGFLTRDLDALGVQVKAGEALDARATAFFSGGVDQVGSADQGAFAEFLDPVYFDGEGRPHDDRPHLDDAISASPRRAGSRS